MFGNEQIRVPKFHANYANNDLSRKDTLTHWGTCWKCIHFIMSVDECTYFNTPTVTSHLQIPYIATTGVLSEMLRNFRFRGSNDQPLVGLQVR
jgi:hypothetical protein